MIGQLTGTVARIDDDTALIDVAGVGYEISATPRTLGRLVVGEPAVLAIETLVAETYIRLIGFTTESERRSFRLLQTVQGVGAKAAVAILQVLDPSELVDAIALGDKTAIARAQGVGPKLAQRIATELAGKTGPILTSTDWKPRDSAPDAPANGSGSKSDAIAALVSLGYDTMLAHKTVAGLDEAASLSVEQLVTRALKELAA